MTAKDIGTPSLVDSSRAAWSRDRAWSCVNTRSPSPGRGAGGNPGRPGGWSPAGRVGRRRARIGRAVRRGGGDRLAGGRLAGGRLTRHGLARRRLTRRGLTRRGLAGRGLAGDRRARLRFAG